MREKRQYRCKISGKCCPFNDDVWESGMGDDIAHDNCPVRQYENNSHLQENGIYLISDFCIHAIPRDKEVKKMEDEKKLLDIVNRLKGVSYCDWMKIENIVNQKFEAQKGELERSLQLPAFEEQDIRW